MSNFHKLYGVAPLYHEHSQLQTRSRSDAEVSPHKHRAAPELAHHMDGRHEWIVLDGGALALEDATPALLAGVVVIHLVEFTLWVWRERFCLYLSYEY